MSLISTPNLTRTAAALLFSLAAACGLPPDETGAAAQSSAAQELVSGAPSLGSAAGFAVLGASTVTCTNASAVGADVGVAPGSSITGFNPGCTTTGTIHAGDAVAVAAHNDLGTAYNGLAGVACQYNLTGRDLGGMTLAPGVYCFDSSASLGGQLRLDGKGRSDAAWIFQIASTLTTASNASVVMVNQGQPCNVSWQIGSSATFGSNTAFKGNVVAFSSITVVSGTSLVGRALALNGAVTLDHNQISLGTCSQPTSSTGGKPPTSHHSH